MSQSRFVYVPLGGAGEIGMNMYAYGYGPEGRERFVVVDAGVMFPDMETTPGVDLIMPDYSWLVEQGGRIDGLFLTHAHEDHIGAVPFLLEELEIPVFARPFTAELTRRKLSEFDLAPGLVRVVKQTSSPVAVGPFSVRFVPVSHSIPEASSLLLEAGGMRVIHTGDLKLDRDPVVGAPFDPEFWTSLGKPGLTALVCDSTNVFSAQAGRSESSVGPALTRLCAETSGAMAATTFASNIARLKQLAEAACAAGRKVVLLGRAMNRMVEVGKMTGILDQFPEVISPEEAKRLPRNRLFLLTTGSQGEPRSATSQLANGKFRGLELTAGDTLLYSSKTIPGNERSIARVINRFAVKGVKVIDDSAGIYHVSGHANRPDLLELYRLVQPECVVPMHGEYRHLVEHADLASSTGLPSFVVGNGTMFDIGAGQVVEEGIPTGRLYLDGHELIEARSGVVRQRLRIGNSGLVCVSIIRGKLPSGQNRVGVGLFGLPMVPGQVVESSIAKAVNTELDRSGRNRKSADEDLKEAVARIVRRVVRGEIGKTPEVGVLIHRL